MNGMVDVMVNGEARAVARGATLLELLESLALDPRPGAWTELDGREIKLFGARVVEDSGAPGEVRGTVDGLRIATGQRAVQVEEVQPAGKARMAAAEWVRGRGAQAGQRFG